MGEKSERNHDDCVFSPSRKMPRGPTKESHLMCTVRMSDRLVAVWTVCDARDRPQDLKGGEGAAGGVSNTDLTIENKCEQTGKDRAQTPVFRACLEASVQILGSF